MWFMVALASLWVMLAVAINWAQAPAAAALFKALQGSSAAVRSGQIWRLFTASIVHSPNTPTHVLVVLMLLWFFATSLQERWGTARLFAFLFGSAALAYGLQTIFGLIWPRLTPDVWFGGMVMADAATVAWAMNNREQTIQLFFVIPMRPLMMVALLAAWQVLMVFARSPSAEGLVAPFGGMLAGWIFCGSSPLRRLYLKLKLKRLQNEVKHITRPRRKPRAGDPKLRVIAGGKDKTNKGPRTLH